MFERPASYLWTLGPGEAALWIVVENLTIFGGALLAGWLVIAACGGRRRRPPPDPLTSTEVLLATLCVSMNVLVTWVGWWLWKAGWIRIRLQGGWAAALDAAILLIAMDAAMYVFHRVAHLPWLFPWLHALHHRTERPRPLTLFVMHPLEAAGFGALWLGLLCVYSPTWAGMSVYLVLNVAWGVLGHVGVDPFPANWSRWPVAGLLSTSGFHEDHHADPSRNLGFYTVIWDRLFRTAA